MQRYVRWWRDGHWSSTGRCFGIGNTVRDVLSRFERTGEPFAGSTDPYSAGNGSIMRLAPVPMMHATNPAAAIRWSAESSRTTHGAREAVDACRYFGGLLVGALRVASKDELLAPRYSPVPGLWEREPPEIRGTGYVVDSLEAALWAFCSGAFLAVNLGDDADTTGAVYGQLAGAFWGVDSIPFEWRERLARAAEIETIADRLGNGPRNAGSPHA